MLAVRRTYISPVVWVYSCTLLVRPGIQGDSSKCPFFAVKEAPCRWMSHVSGVLGSPLLSFSGGFFSFKFQSLCGLFLAKSIGLINVFTFLWQRKLYQPESALDRKWKGALITMFLTMCPTWKNAKVFKVTWLLAKFRESLQRTDSDPRAPWSQISKRKRWFRNLAFLSHWVRKSCCVDG